MAVTDRTLNGSFSGTLSMQYRNTEFDEVGSNNTRDDIRYTDINMALSFGTGLKQADLQAHERVTLVGPTVVTKDFDSDFTDAWGRVTDFNAIKIMIIRNREATNLRPLRYLKVWTQLNNDGTDIKGEQYWIGPGESRIILAPNGVGLRNEIASSSSTDEGDLVLEVTGDYDVIYDLFIIGSSAEKSSSGV